METCYEECGSSLQQNYLDFLAWSNKTKIIKETFIFENPLEGNNFPVASLKFFESWLSHRKQGFGINRLFLDGNDVTSGVPGIVS